ncbi:hypothetical protein ACWEIJ_06775 [Lentzea sp. NPDC004789]
MTRGAGTPALGAAVAGGKVAVPPVWGAVGLVADIRRRATAVPAVEALRLARPPVPTGLAGAPRLAWLRGAVA